MFINGINVIFINAVESDSVAASNPSSSFSHRSVVDTSLVADINISDVDRV